MGSRIVVVASAALLGLLALAAPANAVPPEFLLRMPEGEGQAGGGAGQLNNPKGIAVSPTTGHVYVSDLSNRRISEYTAWGLFVKSWGWGVADGSAELQTCGPAEPEALPPPGLCQAGIEGSGKGQFSRPYGVALDPAGNVYVFDRVDVRVQKFSPAGEFLLMFGGKVNKTKVEEAAPAQQQNICPIAPADVCQKGALGTASSHFAETVGNYLAYSETANAMVVGDKDRIQILNLDGTFREEIPFEGALQPFDGKSVNGLDVDASGNIYISFAGGEDVFKLSPTGVPLAPGKPGESKFGVDTPLAVGVDFDGNVYAIEDPPPVLSAFEARVLKFDPAGSKLFPTETEENEGKRFPFIPFQGPSLNGLATSLCDPVEAPGTLYLSALSTSLSYVDAYGEGGPVECEDPPEVPPEITAQYATEVKTESAMLRAQINPRFWRDATYHVEYGTGKCSEGGCGQSSSPGGLTDKAINKPVTSGSVLLAGLVPGTTYYYRFVSQSGGGGPTQGVGEGSAEGTFTTFRTPTVAAPCANDQFRAGSAVNLPDCRAYELVSPLDKANGDAALVPSTSIFHELNQSATSGERFTYSSITPFAEPEGAPYMSQYLASRDAGSGWSSESISPARTTRAQEVFRSLNNEFKAFSPDLCEGWLRHNSAAILAPGAILGFANVYRRENCGQSESYEALTTAEPPSRPAVKYLVNPVGFSEDGTKTIFLADDALTPEAPGLPEASQKELQLYIHSPAGLRFICHLPNGNPHLTACAAGMAAGQPDGKASAVQNAISEDGSRVFWTAYGGSLGVAPEGIPGNVYLRLNPDQEQSNVAGGACTEPEKACTIPISGTVSTEPAQYWGASEDGSRVIFKFVGGGAESGNLYEFDVESETATQIAEGVLNPMGLSEDATRVYFASSKDLGDGGVEGGRNLYLYESSGSGGGTFSFIMGLAQADLTGSEGLPNAVNEVPTKRSARVTPDGLHATFTSVASPTPTGYDNLDAEIGKPAEVAYLYDAVEDELRCISCNPTGARPAADNISGSEIGAVWAAARLANPRAPLHAPRTVTDDGSRVFFESYEALVPRDTNNTWDVYQWEEPGTGSCTTADATFGTASGGCVDLISSGKSQAESRFLDGDQSGANVFIGTQSSLIGVDFGSNDVYDARIGGGFPLPQRKSSCKGEACQAPPAPPAALTPASGAFHGPGNPPLTKSRRCPKGKHRVRRAGKTRCVRKKHAPGKVRGKRSRQHGRTAR